MVVMRSNRRRWVYQVDTRQRDRGKVIAHLDAGAPLCRNGSLLAYVSNLPDCQSQTTMTTQDDTHKLPLLDKPFPADLNATEIAQEWFSRFAPLVQSGDAAGIVDLLVDDSFWRDVLAITWDFRTFRGPASIKKFLDDRLKVASLTDLKLGNVSLVQLIPTIGWIQGVYTFQVGGFGRGSGVFRLIPAPDGQWKGYTVYTSLTDLKDYPEKGEFRNPLPTHGAWLEERQREVEFADSEPYVVVVGGGMAGLITAARLKHLDIPTLVLEQQDRIGDTWRKRYDTLTLHDPVCEWISSVNQLTNTDEIDEQGTTSFRTYHSRQAGRSTHRLPRCVFYNQMSLLQLTLYDSSPIGWKSTLKRWN